MKTKQSRPQSTGKWPFDGLGESLPAQYGQTTRAGKAEICLAQLKGNVFLWTRHLTNHGGGGERLIFLPRGHLSYRVLRQFLS